MHLPAHAVVRPTAYAFACPCSAWNNHANNMQAPAGDSDGSRYKLKMNPRTEACIFLVDKKCSIYQHRPLQVGRLAVCHEILIVGLLLGACLVFLLHLLCTPVRQTDANCGACHNPNHHLQSLSPVVSHLSFLARDRPVSSRLGSRGCSAVRGHPAAAATC